jgi:hypothetical protein
MNDAARGLPRSSRAETAGIKQSYERKDTIRTALAYCFSKQKGSSH